MSAPVIYINPGHGGKDSGASANGLVEKSINLTVALKVRDILTAAGYTVYMSRTGDTAQSEDTIMADIKVKKPNLVVSIHHNAGGGDGCELFHQRGSITSKEICTLIEAEYKKIGQNSRGVKQKLFALTIQDYYMILRKPYAMGVTSVLSEFAFLDSKDKDIIDTVAEQHKEAEAIANGIMAHFKYKPVQAPVIDPKDQTIKDLTAKINEVTARADGLIKANSELSKLLAEKEDKIVKAKQILM